MDSLIPGFGWKIPLTDHERSTAGACENFGNRQFYKATLADIDYQNQSGYSHRLRDYLAKDIAGRQAESNRWFDRVRHACGEGLTFDTYRPGFSK